MLIHDAHAAEAVLADGVVVDGFLLQQDLSGRTLENALRAIMTGEVPMPAVLAQQLLARAGIRRTPSSMAPIKLTPREHETLLLLVEGLSNKQIARRLKISDHGAKRLVAGVLLKLGCTNRTSAVVTAIRSGLVECAYARLPRRRAGPRWGGTGSGAATFRVPQTACRSGGRS
ncbi:response regulator transcription factor [Micromonospora sp. BRA006-A]|nr:response regulator transcription factor [Micromonospora sp. BRA006-A]